MSLKPDASPSRVSDDDGRRSPTVAPASEPPQVVLGRSAENGVSGAGASIPGREGSPREKETGHRGGRTPRTAEQRGVENLGEHLEETETKRYGGDGAVRGREEDYERRKRNEQSGKGDEVMVDEDEDDMDGEVTAKR